MHLLICFASIQNIELHGGSDEAHPHNRAEENWFQARGWEQRHDPVYSRKRYWTSMQNGPSTLTYLTTDRPSIQLLALFLRQACSKVCAYVSRQVEHVRKSMDGKNVDTVLTELGIRFHRLIHEHLQQYSYSSMGGMLAICDVAEYRRCAKDFRVSEGTEVRSTLVTGQTGLSPFSP